MPGDDSKKVRTRTAYLSKRINEFISTTQRNSGRALWPINEAAETIAQETSYLEDKYIRKHVGHREPNGLLCRHKIIAATQCAIMRHAPLRGSEEELKSNVRAREDGMWTPGIRVLNAGFAHMVTLHMLRDWMITYKQPIKSVEYLEHPDLRQTYNENIFWLTKALAVTSQNVIPQFPFFLVSQFWSMIDRYATVQGGGTFPAYREDANPAI